MMVRNYLKNSLYSVIIIIFISLIIFIIFEIVGRGYSLFVKKNLCAKSLNIEKYESVFHLEVGYLPLPGKKIGCRGEN